MAKWNYLTYNRICHDSFLVHRAKSAVQSEATSEAISEAISEDIQKSNAVAVVMAEILLKLDVLEILQVQLHN